MKRGYEDGELDRGSDELWTDEDVDALVREALEVSESRTRMEGCGYEEGPVTMALRLRGHDSLGRGYDKLHDQVSERYGDAVSLGRLHALADRFRDDDSRRGRSIRQQNEELIQAIDGDEPLSLFDRIFRWSKDEPGDQWHVGD